MIPTAQEIYASMLLHHGHGYPLWIPEPNNALSPSNFAEGTRIGDVGLITSNGGFDYLFNIFLPEADSINKWRGVPEGFRPLEFQSSLIYSTENLHRPRVPIYSQQTKQLMLDVDGTVVIPGMPIGIGSGVELKFSRSRGAALMLPEGASRVDYLGLADIRDYAMANAESWYRFVHGTLRLEADNGSLYVITGFDKTHSYETASFYNTSKSSAVSLRFTSPLLVDGSYGRLSLGHSSDLQTPVSSRVSDPSNRLRNLSVFVRGFKVMIRKRNTRFMRGSAVKAIDVTKAKPEDVMKARPMSSQGSGYSSSSSSSRPSTGDSTNSNWSNQSLALETASFDDVPEEENIFAFSVFDADPPEGVSAAIESPVQNMEPYETFYYPSDAINEYLLEMLPDANVAVTHDEQWTSILDESDEEFPAKQVMLDRTGERFVMVINEGNAWLMEKDDFSPPQNTGSECSIESNMPYIRESSVEDASEDEQLGAVYESDSDSSNNDHVPKSLEARICRRRSSSPDRNRKILTWAEDVKLKSDAQVFISAEKIVSVALDSLMKVESAN